jgi:hypothetical protein
MPAGAYRVAALLPALLLGIIPYLGGLFVASAPLALFGAIFTLAAGADILVVWLIRKVDRHTKVLDHPSRVGCVVVGEGT